MAQDGMVYRSARTLGFIRARKVPGSPGLWEPETGESLDPREWMPGTIQEGVFSPGHIARWDAMKEEMKKEAGSPTDGTGAGQEHP